MLGCQIITKCVVTTERCCELEVKALFPIIPLSSRRQAKSRVLQSEPGDFFFSPLKIFLRKCGDDAIIFVRTFLIL